MTEPTVKRSKMLRPDGSMGEGVEVQVVESTERWSEFTLDDGTVVRFKMVIAAFVRSDIDYDPEGNPVYAVKGSPQLNFISVPDKLMRKGS